MVSGQEILTIERHVLDVRRRCTSGSCNDAFPRLIVSDEMDTMNLAPVSSVSRCVSAEAFSHEFANVSVTTLHDILVCRRGCNIVSDLQR